MPPKTLLDWDYLGILYQRSSNGSSDLDSGTMWECPNFFPLGNKWAIDPVSLRLSRRAVYTYYTLGDYKDNKFLADASPAAAGSWGSELFFMHLRSFTDDKGRKITVRLAA